MAKRRVPEEPIQQRQFSSAHEIDSAIKKLERRIAEVDAVDIRNSVLSHTGQDDVVESNVRETIRDIFGSSSPEFREHQHLRLWAGTQYVNMGDDQIIAGMERGRTYVNGILKGLVARLQEKREDFVTSAPQPRDYFRDLNLHSRIGDVASDLFLDGYHWEAVFAASKALINFVKERSGKHDLDGAPLMRTVFSRSKPILAFNDLKDQTDQDEQEGMMHLFEGVVLGIRNPGGHSFPEGTEQRASEYISLLSLLAYRVQEAKRAPTSPP